MIKFKNRLVSVILLAVTFLGAVTTCLVLDSSVRYCKAEYTQSPTIQEVGSIMNELVPKVISKFSWDPNFSGASHSTLEHTLDSILTDIENNLADTLTTEKKQNIIKKIISVSKFLLCLYEEFSHNDILKTNAKNFINSSKDIKRGNTSDIPMIFCNGLNPFVYDIIQAWYYKYDFESRWLDIHKQLNISIKYSKNY